MKSAKNANILNTINIEKNINKYNEFIMVKNINIEKIINKGKNMLIS